MKIKNALLMVLSLVLVAALAIGGTVAYLTDTDDDVNVMTLGNVKIEQHEYQRADGVDHINNGAKEGDLVPFVQDQPLYPAVPTADDAYEAEQAEANCFHWGDYSPGWNGLWNDSKLANVMDKFVFVENTGKSDAYYRTLIALECPEGMTIGYSGDDEINVNINGNSRFDWDYEVGTITIDGTHYEVWSVTYNEILKPGEVSRPSLLQVVLTHNATNEDMELLGETYDILVLSQAVQAGGFDNAAIALDTAFGDDDAENAAKWFKGVVDEHNTDTWDGTADFAFFGLRGLTVDSSDKEIKESIAEARAAGTIPEDEKIVIGSAEKLAAFAKLVDAGETFEGKTVVLGKSIDLENKLFDPIGSYRFDTSFKGTFDGQGKTIFNLSQNTWELDNGYYYTDCGLGLFGAVEEGTVKNLVIDGAAISGESAICGTVAAVAHNATFENITIKNANVADYQYYAGGIVGWASGEIDIIGCTVDASTNVAAQWGDFDNSIGGVIGGASTSAEILIKDTIVACRIDAYNDVTSSYQWYAYRRAGMLIGNSGATEKVDGTTYAKAPQLTCENVTVIYDDWANYTYCEFAGKNWPYVRVQAGVSNGAYSNPRYGHPTDANGNEVVDDNHIHNEGEDHFIECAFDQLYGGGQGVYGTATHEGVTVVYNNK